MNVAILGSGAMGVQLALLCALRGNPVLLWNHQKREGLPNTLKRIATLNARQGYISKDEIDPAIGRISYSQNLEFVSGCELIIETVSEDYLIKSMLMKSVCQYVKKNTIISTNSSTISTTLLSTNCSNPERFIGLHFFNPPFVRDLVEIIKGEKTSEETIQRATKFCESLQRHTVIMDESPGFIVNRVLFPMINESIFLLYETRIEAKEIDASMKRATGNPMGPLELADFIGLDICLNILETLAKETGDQKYRPAPLLKRLVRAGKLGRKSKIGFYIY
jgi:3-hydroxybutyryl-CoA dehydrogenase